MGIVTLFPTKIPHDGFVNPPIRKFRLWYDKEDRIVKDFNEINDWFVHCSSHTEVRYKGGMWTDKSREWGDEWKHAFILNYMGGKVDLYFEVAYANFIEDDFVVGFLPIDSISVSITNYESDNSKEHE